MKAYVITTGIVFGLLTIMHVSRMVAEGLFKDPHMIAMGLLAGGLCIWSVWVLRRPSAPRG